MRILILSIAIATISLANVDKEYKCEYLSCSENMELFNPSLASKLMDNIYAQHTINSKDENYKRAIEVLKGNSDTFIIKKPLSKCNYTNPLKLDVINKAI